MVEKEVSDQCEREGLRVINGEKCEDRVLLRFWGAMVETSLNFFVILK